jgi:transposase InsO family protein
VSKYELIEAEKASYPITRMIELLGVAGSAYYKWTRRVAAGPTARSVRRSDLTAGVCWDNAQIESFWSTLKHEYYNRQSFATKHEARHGVGRWIEEI